MAPIIVVSASLILLAFGFLIHWAFAATAAALLFGFFVVIPFIRASRQMDADRYKQETRNRIRDMRNN